MLEKNLSMAFCQRNEIQNSLRVFWSSLRNNTNKNYSDFDTGCGIAAF